MFSSSAMAKSPQIYYAEVEGGIDEFHSENETDGFAQLEDAVDVTNAATADPRHLHRRWTWFVLFLGIVLPILGMLQCEGWNEGQMDENMKCRLFNGPLARSYANFCFFWLTMAAFSGGLYLIPYIILIIVVKRVGHRTIDRWHTERIQRLNN
jgi:hypothetical protein